MSTSDVASNKETIKIRPTILIGLGGTGGDILLRIRKRFFEKFGRLEEFPIVSYIWLDTDATEKHVLAEYEKKFVGFTEVEKLMTTIKDTTQITNNLEEPTNSRYRTWWYTGLNTLGQMNEGAGQIRAYSRMGFFKHLESIRNRINTAHGSVTDRTIPQRMRESQILQDLGIFTEIEFDKPINVYILCSIAGGTGSGMFLDTAFLIKRLLGTDSTIVGYLLFPHHFGTITNEKMEANSYAALKELDYYKYGNHKFDVKWLEDYPEGPIDIPPFNYCYVLDSENEYRMTTGGSHYTQGCVFEMLADCIFKDFSHGQFANEKRSARINLDQKLTDFFQYKHDSQGRFVQRFIKRYQSLGFASILLPHSRIKTACSYKLGSKVIDFWGGFDSSFNPADIPNELKKVMNSLKMLEDVKEKKHDICYALLDSSGTADCAKGTDSQYGLLRQLNTWRNNIIQNVTKKVFKSQKKTLQKYLDEEYEAKLNEFKSKEIGEDPDRWGHFPRMLRYNLNKLFENKSRELEKVIYMYLDDKQSGITYVVSLLRECVSWLDKYAADFQVKNDESEKDRLKADNLRVKLWKDIGKHEHRQNYDGRKEIILDYDVERYMDALVNTAAVPGLLQSMLQIMVRREAIDFCIKMKDFIEGEVHSDGTISGGLIGKFDRLKKDLERLREKFDDGFNYFYRKEDHPFSFNLYKESDFETKYYKRYVKDQEVVKKTGVEALAELERRISGLSLDTSEDRFGKWQRAILLSARRKFHDISKDFHVVKVFFEEVSSQERETELAEMFKNSGICIRKGDRDNIGDLSEDSIYRMVGIPTIKEITDPEGKIGRYISEMKEIIKTKINPKANFYEIPDTSEIIFYTEAGGFPISYVRRLESLREKYSRLYNDGACLHIDKYDRKFRDLFVYKPEERVFVEEAYNIFLLSSLFNTIQCEEGPKYKWQKQVGAVYTPVPLGDQTRTIHKLFSEETTRNKIGEISYKIRDGLLQNKDTISQLSLILSYYRIFFHGEKWGHIQDVNELDFDKMMLVLAIERFEELMHKSAQVLDEDISPLEPGTGLKDVEKLILPFAVRRPDGLYSMKL